MRARERERESVCVCARARARACVCGCVGDCDCVRVCLYLISRISHSNAPTRKKHPRTQTYIQGRPGHVLGHDSEVDSEGEQHGNGGTHLLPGVGG